MNREEIEKLVEESARQARGNKKSLSVDTIRKWLNVLFIISAAIGLVLYFAVPENRILGLCIIGTGMFLKIIEFFLRFLF